MSLTSICTSYHARDLVIIPNVKACCYEKKEIISEIYYILAVESPHVSHSSAQ
jgi:hypothetical protein